jgi:membrane protease YdiL (CAAX protease family)
MVLSAIAIGFLIRFSWWCQLVAGISFGFYSNGDASAIIGPQFTFRCPQWGVVALGILVMAVLVPLTEEFINRGLVQSALYRYGPPAAIAGSATVFTVFHPPGGWVFVFVAGLVFGAQFWITRSLWASLITHATVNGLIQLDWRCLSGQWNPVSSDLPLAIPGSIAALLFLACLSTVSTILWTLRRGDVPPR